MADEPTTEPAQPDPEPPPAKDDDTLGDAGKKALDRMKAERDEAKRQAKANADAAKKLAEIEDAQKTETQRLVDRAEAAERERDDVTGRLLRLEVALEKGLTAAQAKRLVGATRDELEADADELLETFKPAQPAEPPAPSFDLGARRAPVSEPTNPQDKISAGLAQYLK